MPGQMEMTKEDTLIIDKQGESIADLVRRHLTNESHTTTDEELKNVRLNIYSVEGLNN